MERIVLVLGLSIMTAGCGTIFVKTATPPSPHRTTKVSAQFAGQATRDLSCLSSSRVPGHPDAKIQDCWVGTLQGRSFRFLTWTTPAVQGTLLVTNSRSVVNTIGTASIYAFSGQYVCWKQGAMANGGATDLVTGKVILSGSGGQWASICPSAEGVRFVEGLPQKYHLITH